MGGNGAMSGTGQDNATSRGGAASTRGRTSGGSGRDAIALLTSDHRTVDRLLAQARRDATAVETIRTELEAHSTVEEEIFYPAVRTALKEKGQEMVEEAVQEHNEVRELLEELVAMETEDDDYSSKLNELKEKIQHHVKEEEGEMFPQARQALGQDRLRELGQEMESRKEELKGEMVEA
jgi:iron-sulfur cluster repair protein YtfE (RIC family)